MIKGIVCGYLPENFNSYTFVHRNSFAFSLGLSEILTSKMKAAFFADVVMQEVYCLIRFNVSIFKIEQIITLEISEHWAIMPFEQYRPFPFGR